MPTLNLKENRKPKTVNNNRAERKKIYNTARWQATRKLVLQMQPLCAECMRMGVIEPAVDVHHIDSFMNYKGAMREKMAFDFDNLQGLCKSCHGRHHHQGIYNN